MITCAVLGTTECRLELITVTPRNELSAEERVENWLGPGTALLTHRVVAVKNALSLRVSPDDYDACMVLNRMIPMHEHAI